LGSEVFLASRAIASNHDFVPRVLCFCHKGLGKPFVIPILRSVIGEQNQIGWQQLMRGRFSAQWAILQDKYYRMIKADRRKKTGGIWVKRIILFLWKRVEIAWRDRCDSLHGVDPAEASKKLRAKMVPII
jgi:hypothetical protein